MGNHFKKENPRQVSRTEKDYAVITSVVQYSHCTVEKVKPRERRLTCTGEYTPRLALQGNVLPQNKHLVSPRLTL